MSDTTILAWLKRMCSIGAGLFSRKTRDAASAELPKLNEADWHEAAIHGLLELKPDSTWITRTAITWRIKGKIYGLPAGTVIGPEVKLIELTIKS